MGNVKYSDYKTSGGFIKFLNNTDGRAVLDPETNKYTHTATFDHTYEYLKIQFIGQYDLYLNGSNEKVELDFNFSTYEYELKDMAINSLKIVYNGNVDMHCLQYTLLV